MRFATTLVLLGALGASASAQRPSESSRGGTSKTVQPKIMVIPFVKEGEDILKVIEGDFNRRVAMTAVKAGFDKRKFTTIDVRQVINGMSNNQGMQSTSQTDIKKEIVDQSRSDIYVEVELQTTTEGQDRRVSLIMTAYLSANSMSLANKSGSSGPYRVPMEMIVERAVNENLDDLLATMQQKFDGFVEDGIPLRMEISVAQGAKDLERTVGTEGDQLGDAIEEWLRKSAYKNIYHISGRTKLHMTVDEVRVPLFDPKTGQNFNASQFSLELSRYLRTLNVSASRSMTGTIIYVEIK